MSTICLIWSLSERMENDDVIKSVEELGLEMESQGFHHSCLIISSFISGPKSRISTEPIFEVMMMMQFLKSTVRPFRQSDGRRPESVAAH